MRHIIQRQVIDLAVSPALDAHAVQDRMAWLFMEELFPRLEKLFDSLSVPSHTLILESISIDLGRITLEQLYQNSFMDELWAMIGRELEEHFRPESPAAEHWETRALSVFRQWLWYMEKGYLPWNADLPDEKWYMTVLESAATEIESVRSLRQLIRNRPVAIERIVKQHPEAFLRHLAELLTAKNQKELPAAIRATANWLTRVYQKDNTAIPRSEEQAGVMLWCRVFESLAEEQPADNPSTEQILRKILVSIIPVDRFRQMIFAGPNQVKAATTAVVHNELLARLINERCLPVPVLLAALSMGQHSNPDKKAPEFGQDALSVHCRSSDSRLGKYLQTTSAQALKGEGAKVEFVERETAEQGIYASNAGLVLLHPFLSPFFRALDIWNGRSFRSEECRHRAIFLLHFLATGRDEADEHELIIPKFLLQFPLAAPVSRSGNLTSEEKQECQELLNDLVAQWSILKNTSADGLRETFLQRSGKLVRRNEVYHLLVEESSIDLLLDYLPWNLGMVMLPWMKDRLLVEWRFRK